MTGKITTKVDVNISDTSMTTLDKLGQQILDLDIMLGELSKRRDDLRKSIIDQMTSLSIDSFSGVTAKLSVSKQLRVKSVDIVAIAEDFDLSDCWELSVAKIKRRSDIPLEDYTIYNKIEILRVKSNEK